MGKGKKGSNKPPNPNPPQKIEVKPPEKEDVVENVVSELKIEERVPEIVSEVVADEVKVIEEPKKPKRNRGKKKKNDKEEIDESGDEKPVENIEEDVKVEVEESKVEVKEHTPSEKPDEVPNVAPTARKKKNKNKNVNTEAIKEPEIISKDDEAKELLPVPVEVSDIKRDVSPKPVEDVKPAKKKNKKKKPHDSEKSDKEEISCTAAFQQLLVEDEKVEKKDDKEEKKSTLSVENKDMTDVKSEIIPEVIPEIPTTQEDIPGDNLSKGHKNKKKGKKDKQYTKTDIKEEVQLPTETVVAEVCEGKSKLESDIVEMITEKIKETELISESAPEVKPIIEDVKSKAKIAKPVDKKKKEKSNQALKEEELSENIAENKTEVMQSNIIISEMEDILQEQPKCEIPSDIEKEIQFDDVTPMPLPELETLPQSIGKKRKKSPKPPLKQQTESEKKDVESKKEIKETKDEIVAESKIIVETSTTEQVIEKDAFKETEKHKILETPVAVTTELEFIKDPVSEIKEAIPQEASSSNLEIKSGKKRKKSPKPTKLKIAEEKEPENKETESTTKSESIVQAEISEIPTKPLESERKTDIFQNMPPTKDIEITSLKADESECSSAEVLPDIQYPRAVSQQRVDNNNNTIIREVSPSIKLGIPVFVPDTPFVQGGEIPLTSPELVASGISVIDVEANVVRPSEEKTDIKSKMMEVNQDMEELRLSIERSLAELTSMEKREIDEEKKFEEKHKIEETKSDSDNKATLLESKDIEVTKQKQSEILMIENKPREAIMPAPPPKSNKKEKKQMEDMPHPSLPVIPLPPPLPKDEIIPVAEEIKPTETITSDAPPPCPARKDNKGKGKSKKKGKQETGQAPTVTEAASSTSDTQTSKETSQDTKKEEKKEQKSGNSQENTKKQSDINDDDNNKDNEIKNDTSSQIISDFEPIESFEDAMTSSLDDVNQTFEMIASESSGSQVNPEINIIAPTEDSKADPKDEKKTPVKPPKNLLGHPVIPVRSNRMDYKKEKNKTPNTTAKVKIKDGIEIESKKESKESQTDNIKKLMQKKFMDESISTLNENEEFVYKYSFRKVFLPNVCHVCKKELKSLRVSCSYCHLLFYCNQKHKDEDWPQHQGFCFAVSTIVHLKDQKHIYEDAATITGHNYRLLRMQMIVSCEKILKRKLLPWEQEALLYPRVCGDVLCREWRLNRLTDCDGCGQIAYCLNNPDHLPKSHQRWCKSYSLYQKLVCHQQTIGRLEPKLPSRVMSGSYQLPDKINEVLAAMYEEKIDMNDVEYAALTQLATAPLTAVFGYQLYNNKMNSIYANGTYKKTSFTIHVVGAELQFEADALNKWEVFFMHLRPDILELRVSLIAPDLNPSKLPLDLLGKVKLCEQCRQEKRRLLFSFQDKKTYSEYYRGDDFTTPDIVCAFNPSIQRSSVYNGKDPWPGAVSCILKQKVPFTITSYTLDELRRDLSRIKESAEFSTISEPKHNVFASVRPDRNFISDDEIPLLFKNYCFSIISGVF